MCGLRRKLIETRHHYPVRQPWPDPPTWLPQLWGHSWLQQTLISRPPCLSWFSQAPAKTVYTEVPQTVSSRQLLSNMVSPRKLLKPSNIWAWVECSEHGVFQTLDHLLGRPPTVLGREGRHLPFRPHWAGSEVVLQPNLLGRANSSRAAQVPAMPHTLILCSQVSLKGICTAYTSGSATERSPSWLLRAVLHEASSSRVCHERPSEGRLGVTMQQQTSSLDSGLSQFMAQSQVLPPTAHHLG
jgi:hypothetical protein